MLRRLYLAYLPQYVPPVEVAVKVRASGAYSNSSSNSTDKHHPSSITGKSATGDYSHCRCFHHVCIRLASSLSCSVTLLMVIPCFEMHLDTNTLIIICANVTCVCVACDVHDRAFLTLGSESHSATGNYLTLLLHEMLYFVSVYIATFCTHLAAMLVCRARYTSIAVTSN
jgi:hypothetical protein